MCYLEYNLFIIKQFWTFIFTFRDYIINWAYFCLEILFICNRIFWFERVLVVCSICYLDWSRLSGLEAIPKIPKQDENIPGRNFMRLMYSSRHIESALQNIWWTPNTRLCALRGRKLGATAFWLRRYLTSFTFTNM